MDSRKCYGASKADEVGAMHRHHGHNLKTFMHVSEFFLGITILITWHSTSFAMAAGATGNCLSHMSSLFSRPISMFLVSNGIVAAVFVLSGGKAPDNAAGSSSDDIYDEEYVYAQGHPTGGISPVPEVDGPLPALTEKQEAVLSQRPQQCPAVSQDKESTVVTVRQDVKQEGSANVREPRGMLSEPEGGDWCKKVANEEEEPEKERGRRSRSVEDLSTEEFNLRVEKYIARTRRLLHKERLDDMLN